MSTPKDEPNRGINISRLAVIAALGFSSCVGFAVSGMTNPGSLLNFMDFRRIPGVGEFLQAHLGRSLASPATWDPSVLIVFATALGSQLPLYQLFVKNRKEALFGGPIVTPSNPALDFRLIGGAVLFGAGWALAGFCPGPALASAFAGAPKAATFVSMVLLGMFANTFILDNKFSLGTWLENGKTTGLVNSLIGMGTLSAGLGLFRQYAPLLETLTPAKIPTGPIPPLGLAAIGGAIIGITGFAYTLGLGKTMGLSGMLSQHFQPTTTNQDRLERWTFLAGLGSAALFLRFYHPSAFISSAPDSPMWKVILSGLMVGFGTSCSNGCTSGHGLAGISRFALRSLVATVAFFGTNVLVSTFLM
jgi:uncharacterized membrane protein YedE/YeeE